MIRQTSYWITHRTITRQTRTSAVAIVPSITAAPADVVSAVREYARFIPSNVVLGMILLASIFICVTVISRTRAELNSSRLDYEQIKADVTSARHMNATLRIDIERARFDPTTIETLARERLGMVRPGDLVVPVEINPTASSLSTFVR